jgi:hypothetical protein
VGQVSAKLRRGVGRFFHWCPACNELHQLPDGWAFNGDLNAPTFTPSFKHSGMQAVVVDGEWTGEFVRDAAGAPVPFVCHYILTAGVLNFCADCTHGMAGQAVPLPDLPAHARDRLNEVFDGAD